MVAGPPGFEPGTRPQVGFLAKAFRVASHGFEAPRGKSLNDADEASPMLYLTELRALTLRLPDVIKSILQAQVLGQNL